MSRLTINTRVKPVDTFDRSIEKKKEDRKNRRHRAKKILPKDTHIQVPGTVVAAAAATISDRRITSAPLPRIVILSPLQASEEISNFVLQVFAERDRRHRINRFIRRTIGAAGRKSCLAERKRSSDRGEIKVRSMHHTVAGGKIESQLKAALARNGRLSTLAKSGNRGNQETAIRTARSKAGEIKKLTQE